MIYSVEKIANTHLNNFVIDPPFYQEEYDYNNCILRLKKFLINLYNLKLMETIELVSLLGEEEINEKEMLTELMIKTRRFDSFDESIENDFNEAIHYWEGLYSLEDNNFDTF